MEKRTFKTSAKCNGCVSRIDAALEGRLADGSWSIDLTSPDKLLIVEDDSLSDDDIVTLVKSAGFKAERL